MVEVNPGVSVTLRRRSSQTVLVTVDANGGPHASLGSLDPQVLPYANSLLASTSVSIIKDWRTKQYRVKSRKSATTPATPTPNVAATVAAAQVGQPSAAAQHTAGGEAPAATITVSATNGDDESPTVTAVSSTLAPVVPSNPIPGMIYPKGKARLKGAGRGWTDVGGIVVPTADYETLARSWNLRQQGKLGSVIITGPAGTAKTMLVQAFAATLGVPYLKVDCSAIRSADDWGGAYRQDPNTKTWAHKWSPFALALRAGQPCVILLDDLTRTEQTTALNALLGLLDDTGSLLVPDANAVLTMPNGIMVVATANIGPEFVGALPLDGAVRQRFRNGIRMGYPTEAVEAKVLVDRAGISRETADSLVRMAVQQRAHRDNAELYPSGNVISTRLLLGMAENIADGALARDAVWAVLKGQFDPADDVALTVVVDSQFPKVQPKAAPAQSTPATITTDRHWYTSGNVGPGAPCQYSLPDGTVCFRDSQDRIHFGNS